MVFIASCGCSGNTESNTTEVQTPYLESISFADGLSLNETLSRDKTTYTITIANKLLYSVLTIDSVQSSVSNAKITIDGQVFSAPHKLSLPISKTHDFKIVLTNDTKSTTYTITVNRIVNPTYFKASNADTDDSFGYDVDISGNIVAISAPGEDSSATGIGGNASDNTVSDSGAVYIFTKDSGDSWTQTAYIKASNTDANDSFGVALSLSGSSLIVGAFNEDSSAINVWGDETDNTATKSGSAYIFKLESNSWSQKAYVKASNTGTSDNFGSSVAISDSFAIIGAIAEDSSSTTINGTQTDNSASDSGAIYLYQLK